MKAGEVLTVEDGFRAVAALIRIQHGPACPDFTLWRRFAAVLEDAATGAGDQAKALAVCRMWGEVERVPA